MSNERIVNFNNVNESSYIDKDGVYTFKVAKVEGKTNSNGKEYDRYTLETVDKETMLLDLYIQENALFKYKKFLLGLGVDTSMSSIDLNTLPATLIGKSFVGTVKRRDPVRDLLTGEMVESKYFDIVKFDKV